MAELMQEKSPERAGADGMSSVKHRVRQIEIKLSESKKDLNENRKESQVIASELSQLDVKQRENSNEIFKEIMEDVLNLEKDFRKLVEQDNNEVNFLKQQIQQTNAEKTKLQQNVVILDTRTTHVEQEVGYE